MNFLRFFDYSYEYSHSKDTNIPLFVKSESRWVDGICS